MRRYRCIDCPPSAPEYVAGARGPLPERCPEHRRARDLRRERRRRSPLRLVDVDESPPSPPDPPDPPPSSDDAEQQAGAGPIGRALRKELDALWSSHPAGQTLERVAEVLAMVLDSPVVTTTDPRVVPSLSRELRAIVHELAAHEKDSDQGDDLFGGSGPVVTGS
jgi:hypothetical protein